MSTRTFKQLGRGYLSDQVLITAKINGNIVYSGPVPSSNEPLPQLPATDLLLSDTLFTWENPLEFTGQQQLEVSVTEGVLILTNTFANYSDSRDLVGTFRNFYSYQGDGMIIVDPLENEKIDGVAQIENRAIGNLNGQWWWSIPAGSTFTATINVGPPAQPLPPSNP